MPPAARRGLTGCGDGASCEGAQKRTVLVDYRHDETEMSMFEYFPKKVTVRPGDTVEFKQAWTGEDGVAIAAQNAAQPCSVEEAESWPGDVERPVRSGSGPRSPAAGLALPSLPDGRDRRVAAPAGDR